MQTNYGERPGLTVDGGAVNADGVDMSGFMAVLHDAGTDECGNVTVSSGLWSRIKCEHYAALAEAARLREIAREARAWAVNLSLRIGPDEPAMRRALGGFLDKTAAELGPFSGATEAGKDGAR